MGKYKKNNKQLNTLGKREKLTEAPDDLGFLTDDEIEEQERQEFEKRLAQRKAQRDTAKSQELDRQEQERQKEQAKKEAEAKGKELYAKVKDLPFEEWFDILVPQSGKAPTVAGEIVRAVNRIAYRYWNDGDKFYEGYGRETCGSSAAYLYEIEPFYELLTDMVDMNGDAYEQATNKLCDIAQDYLLDTPELFGEINEHDSRSDKEYDINAISEFDEPHDFEYTVHLEDYVNDNLDICLADFVNNGYVDSFEIIDRLEEDANAECNTYNEIHCDRPSTHSDTEYTFVDLTSEQYETIRNFMDRSDYFDSYIQELYDEFGDPNAKEDEYEDEEESLKESNNNTYKLFKIDTTSQHTANWLNNVNHIVEYVIARDKDQAKKCWQNANNKPLLDNDVTEVSRKEAKKIIDMGYYGYDAINNFGKCKKFPLSKIDYELTVNQHNENLKEDTVKQGNKWVNKGNTGKTHGEFKTKKQADAQRKAMFVNKKKNSNWGK